jgi:hypothetical protein
LCDDNLVYHCDLFEGIEAGLLSPFRYLGVPDEVDYAQIPWRSAQFDPNALEAALATETRAQNALEQFHRHREGPAIGFCCSVRHAEFMAAHFGARGLRAVAVHSGPGSAPRATSLEQLGRGEIDILFAVDMFNEGVDVPNIGTVMMLRPTESAILWLQQLGRGLRRVEGKLLRVIDYISNHRIFLTKLYALLAAGPGDRSLSQRLDQVLAGTLELPPGCSVTYDLRVVEMGRACWSPMMRVWSSRGLAAAKGGRRRQDGILTGAQTVPVFLLLRQVKMPKKLDLDGLAREATARLPGAILGAWKG